MTSMLVSLQAENIVAAVPPEVTELLPWTPPKFAPVIVIGVPVAPEGWLKVLMVGGMVTVKFTPLLGRAPTVTTTLPVFAPVGTVTAILVALQLANVVAAVPPKVTELPVGLERKFVPLMVICAPTAPEFGLSEVIFGATVKETPLLGTLEIVTTTLPVMAAAGTATTTLVSLQLVAAPANTPPKVTVQVS